MMGEKIIVFYEVVGAVFEPNKMHIYDCKTKGKHPVHIIDGGSVITEDEMDESYWNSGHDLGWFYLNQKEYDYFKSQCKKMKVEVVY